MTTVAVDTDDGIATSNSMATPPGVSVDAPPGVSVESPHYQRGHHTDMAIDFTGGTAGQY